MYVLSWPCSAILFWTRFESIALQSLIRFNAAPSDLFYSIRREPFLIQDVIAVFAHAVCAENNKKLMKKSTGCNELVILLDLYLELIFIVVGGKMINRNT